jgi:uncharacterized membrane protein
MDSDGQSLTTDSLPMLTFLASGLAFVVGVLIAGLAWTQMHQVETALRLGNAFAEAEYNRARLWFGIGLVFAAVSFVGMLGIIFYRLGPNSPE